MKHAPAALCFLVLVLPLATVAQSRYPPTMQGARVEIFQSSGDFDLKLWIFEPDGHDATQSRPAIVFFFGGGWRAGTPAQFEHHARHFASRGMVAIAADYRVLNRNGTTIDVAVRDAKAAIRWVRKHADRLGVDPDRLAAAGGSSGGHLAASTAILPAHDEISGDSAIRATPDALVLFNPAVILAPVDEHPDIAMRAASGRYGSAADRESLSPYHHVRAGLPPTIIIHGKADATVPFRHAEIFAEAMRAAGNRCELIGYEGAGHGFFNHGRGDGSAYADTVQRMDEFLVSLGWLSDS